jgi:xanthine/CO dehydrogenase XdhC/CoxF family maturation factor
MSELLQVAAALTRAAGEGQVSVLATVVRTEGSTYRRIGARLVAMPDGSHVGSVSAGCMEGDIVLRAAGVRSSGTVELITYNTRSPEDLIWGSGSGCGGVTELLLEPLNPELALAKAERFRMVAESRHRGVLATVIRASGLPLRSGDQAVLPHATASLVGFEDAPARFRAIVRSKACHHLRAASSMAVSHVWGEQALDIAYEVWSPRIRLCVCGAGPDATPLVAMAKWMGWKVRLIDHRPVVLSPERWPEVDCTLVRSTEELIAAVRRVECDAAVIMNHHYERDLRFLGAWLASDVLFIGILGPQRRTAQMLDTLAGSEVPLDRVEHRIHAPVGLDFGGETVEEIALSIIAEIKASAAGRVGGPLRDRHGPIHAREMIHVRAG